VVDQTGASWNRFQLFIQRIDTLRLDRSMAEEDDRRAGDFVASRRISH
jgi:hypothetical protein